MGSNVFDCQSIDLPQTGPGEGSVSFLQNDGSLPFSIKRVYYTYDVTAGTENIGRAHRALQQVIIAVNGSFTIAVDDGNLKREIFLSRPHTGLYLPAGLWRSVENFSNGATCLVLASDSYKEEDYIRNYHDFLHFKTQAPNL